MAKQSRRLTRRTRPPRAVRYSASGQVRREIHHGFETFTMLGDAGEETRRMLEDSAARFEAKFGRPPGPTDPVFWDPDADTPQPLELAGFTDRVVETMRSLGVDEELVFAYAATQRFVTEENLPLLTDAERDEWFAAVRLYRTLGDAAWDTLGPPA